jgi:hypothetical protein
LTIQQNQFHYFQFIAIVCSFTALGLESILRKMTRMMMMMMMMMIQWLFDVHKLNKTLMYLTHYPVSQTHGFIKIVKYTEMSSPPFMQSRF